MFAYLVEVSGIKRLVRYITYPIYAQIILLDLPGIMVDTAPNGLMTILVLNCLGWESGCDGFLQK